MQLGVAFIGLGTMGTRMLGSLTINDSFRIVSAWDPSQDARDAVGSDFPDTRIANDAADAISDEKVDIVYIACPPSKHLEYALMAADAGKAVYCEKPLGVNIGESETLVEAFNERGITCAVNFPFAAAPTIDFVGNEIRSGALGEIVGVDVRLHFVPWPRGWQQAATWLARRAEGGYVREVGSHFIFLVEKLFGRAELVDSSVTYPADEKACETHFTARLNCAGVPISMSGNSVGVGPDTVEFIIWGSEMSILLNNWSEIHVTTGGAWDRREIHEADAQRENNTRFFGDLERLVIGQPNTMASFEDALSVQRIVETILAT